MVHRKRIRGTRRIASCHHRSRRQPGNLPSPNDALSVCILHGPGAEQSVIERTFKAVETHNVEAWEADRDGPLTTITSRLKGTTLIVTLGSDGTFLAGGRLAAPPGIPVAGVDLGPPRFLLGLQ